MSHKFGDLTDPEALAQLDYHIWASPMVPNLWGAIPCAAGCVWQRLNVRRSILFDGLTVGMKARDMVDQSRNHGK